MKVVERLWIDPPSGWLYGFPKLWIPEKHGNLRAWLISNGYPAKELHSYTIIRQWPDEQGEAK